MTAIKSMTGYACAQSQDHESGDSIEVNIKAVNGRYVEIICACNYELGALEQELHKKFKSQVLRGKVNVAINYQRAHHQLLELNENVLLNVLENLNTIHKHIDSFNQAHQQQHAFDAQAILNFPGVVTNLSSTASSIYQSLDARQASLVLALFAQALSSFDAQRQQEGAQLEQVLRDKINKIKTLLNLIENKQDSLVERERERINQKLKSLKVDIDPSRIEGEVALLAQKCDITEEYDRLKCHIQAVEELITPNDKPYEAVGKKLDFLMQELMRETNTMASKANSLDLVDIAVDLKVLIDQMREQIQNIE